MVRFAELRVATQRRKTDDAAEVENMLKSDPYLINGVGGERTLREWSPIIAGRIGNE